MLCSTCLYGGLMSYLCYVPLVCMGVSCLIYAMFHLFAWGSHVLFMLCSTCLYGGLMSYLRYLCLFPYSCVQLCYCFVCLCLVYTAFLWIVHIWIAHRYSRLFPRVCHFCCCLCHFHTQYVKIVEESKINTKKTSRKFRRTSCTIIVLLNDHFIRLNTHEMICIYFTICLQ
jgi:hypothetical protein